MPTNSREEFLRKLKELMQAQGQGAAGMLNTNSLSATPDLMTVLGNQLSNPISADIGYTEQVGKALTPMARKIGSTASNIAGAQPLSNVEKEKQVKENMLPVDRLMHDVGTKTLKKAFETVYQNKLNSPNGIDEVSNALNQPFLTPPAESKESTQPQKSRLIIKQASNPFSTGGIVQDPETGNITWNQRGFIDKLAYPNRSDSQDITGLAALQKLLGEEPIQIGEQQKGLMELQKQLSIKGMEGLAPAAASQFSALMEGREATMNISNMLSNDVNAQLLAQSVPNFMKSQEGKIFESTLEQAIQAKTRAETGAAMQPAELKNTMKRYSPKMGDSNQTALKRLSPLFDYFNQGIAVADPIGIHTQRAMQARQTYLNQAMPGTNELIESSNITKIKRTK